MGWVRSCPGLFLQKALAELNGTFAWFTEQDQAFGYLGITKAQAHFLQKPDFLIKSISWEFGSLFLISDIPVIKARIQLLAAPPRQHPEQGAVCAIIQGLWKSGVSVCPGQSCWACFCIGVSALTPHFNTIIVGWKAKDADSPLTSIVI